MLQRTSAEKYGSSKPLSSLRKTVEGEASSAPLDESTVLGAILRRECDPELNGSVGEGSNQTNYSDRNSVRILAKFRNFR